MDAKHDIVITGKTRLRAPKRIIKPSLGETRLRCRNCGSMHSYAVMVRVVELIGRVSSIACTHCGMTWRVELGVVGDGEGKLEANP